MNTHSFSTPCLLGIVVFDLVESVCLPGNTTLYTQTAGTTSEYALTQLRKEYTRSVAQHYRP